MVILYCFSAHQIAHLPSISYHPPMAQGRHNNNFDLLRILAALQVATYHAILHTGIDVGRSLDFLEIIPGVPIFFVISGFLVSESFERTDLRTYLINRALRIYPAMWGCLAVSIAIAVLWGDVSFDTPALWSWLVAQTTFVQFYNPAFLRGFGTGVLNGSLWTIPVELQFYIAVPILYAFLRSWRALLLAIIAFAVVNQAFIHWDGSELAKKIGAITVLPYLYMFLLGVFLQRNRYLVSRYLVGRLPLWLGIFIAAQAMMYFAGLSVGGNHLNPLSATLLALLVICAAHTRSMGLRHDLSYGLYLYHMPVINALVARGERSYGSAAAAVAIAIGLAFLSWVLLERPALMLKRVFTQSSVRSHAKSPPRPLESR